MERPPAAPAGQLLRALRPAAGRRRAVDAGLAGGLRAWLEDGVAPVVTDGGRPLVVDRWAVAPAGAGRPFDARPGGTDAAGARQAMVAALFRQLVATGEIGQPFDDAVAALRMTDWGCRVVASVSSLPRATRQALRREVTADGRAMAEGWVPVPAAWLPRTDERLSVALAGGRVVLRATAALAVGVPAADRASVALLDVRAGEPLAVHAADRRFLALVETLRSGAPPCRVATYYPSPGRLEVGDPDDEELAATVAAVIDAVPRLAAAVPPC